MRKGIKMLAVCNAEIIAEKGKMLFTEDFLKTKPELAIYLSDTVKAESFAGGYLVKGDSTELYELLVHVLREYAPAALIV